MFDQPVSAPDFRMLFCMANFTSPFACIQQGDVIVFSFTLMSPSPLQCC